MKRNLNTPALDIVGNLAPTLPNNTGMAITKPSRMNGFPRNTAWGSMSFARKATPAVTVIASAIYRYVPSIKFLRPKSISPASATVRLYC